jgi:probable HAF family extracellular repeat protein
MRLLGELPGGESYSLAKGINASGSVVVGISGSASGPEAFRWTVAGMQGLGDLPGRDFSSEARAVSADGLVVVGESMSYDWWEAFRWTSATGMQPLGSLSTTVVESSAHAVSGDGSIVVGDSASVNASGEAFIWDEAHGMRSLKQVLVVEYGLDLSGWSLFDATGISLDGKTIVGAGLNPSGLHEGWIASVPEPATGVTLATAIGVASLLRRRRAFGR